MRMVQQENEELKSTVSQLEDMKKELQLEHIHIERDKSSLGSGIELLHSQVYFAI